ncbi:MAG: metalloregulator ArsR/SmtB family transcription factor [Polyangiaceae bacterium]
MPDDAATSEPTKAKRWELYRVLSEPVRLRLLALTAEEELAIGELAELLDESQPNVSRHAAPLRQSGLLAVRKEGTRTFLRLADASKSDAVVADAVTSGRALCHSDGSLRRIESVLRARELPTREFFSRDDSGSFALSGAPAIGAYLAALATLIADRSLAVDVGTGDGSLLDVLAPTFTKVVAVDREETQLARARQRVQMRGYSNVVTVAGDLESKELRKILGEGASVVFASRVLHHAPRPAQELVRLAKLVKPGGHVIVLDYARHDDESMRAEADLWLGFAEADLVRFAEGAGLVSAHVFPIDDPLRGPGRDGHLPWHVLTARKPLDASSVAAKDVSPASKSNVSHEKSRTARRKGQHHGSR